MREVRATRPSLLHLDKKMITAMKWILIDMEKQTSGSLSLSLTVLFNQTIHRWFSYTGRSPA